jgi:multisubunit Na+/H+ antiporter MnhE subunit
VRLVYWCVEWVLLFVLWLAIAGFSRNEMIAGSAASAVAAGAVEAVRGLEYPRFYPYLRWILEAWRIPGQIAADTVLLVRKLGRMIFLGDRDTGHFQSIPFRAHGNDSRCVARRALATTYVTLPPNSIVIGIDRDHDWMLIHFLEPAPLPPIIRLLEEHR